MSITTDAKRLQLRPELDTSPAISDSEAFQNQSLRPILKLQHQLLVDIATHYLAKRKVSLEQTARVQRRDKLKELLTRDNRFRSLLFGITIGQFTAAEMAYYLNHEGETNRRITNLLLERLLSVLG